jgi:hypothetical protein
MDFRTSALILAWLAILILALGMSGLLRQVRALSTGRTSQPQAGPVIGGPAPPLIGDDGVEPGATTVALFVDASCGSCAGVLRLGEELAAAHDDRLRFVAVYPTNPDGVEHRRVRVVENRSAFLSYRVPVTPYGVVVDHDGRIAHAGPLGSDELLRDLVAGAVERRPA